MRIDTTVAETNIHYPTDRSLLADGVRVLTRTMKRIVEIGGKGGERVRDRIRSVSHRVMDIARTTRAKGQKLTKEKLQGSYKRLLHVTGRVIAQAGRIAEEVRNGIKKSKQRDEQLRLEALQAELERMIPLVRQVMRQTKARLFRNDGMGVLKRRHGLNRCRYRGDDGMKRWIGLSVNCRQSDQYRPSFGPEGDGSLKKDRKKRIDRISRLKSARPLQNPIFATKS